MFNFFLESYLRSASRQTDKIRYKVDFRRSGESSQEILIVYLKYYHLKSNIQTHGVQDIDLEL